MIPLWRPDESDSPRYFYTLSILCFSFISFSSSQMPKVRRLTFHSIGSTIKLQSNSLALAAGGSASPLHIEVSFGIFGSPARQPTSSLVKLKLNQLPFHRPPKGNPHATRHQAGKRTSGAGIANPAADSLC